MKLETEFHGSKELIVVSSLYAAVESSKISTWRLHLHFGVQGKRFPVRELVLFHGGNKTSYFGVDIYYLAAIFGCFVIGLSSLQPEESLVSMFEPREEEEGGPMTPDVSLAHPDFR